MNTEKKLTPKEIREKFGYVYVYNFHEGLAKMLDEGGWCHIGLDGKPIYKHRYLDVGRFHNGRATARDKNGMFHIKKDGTPAYEERYHKVRDFCPEGFAIAMDGNKFKSKEYLLDRDGKNIFPPFREITYSEYDGFLIVEEYETGKTNYIETKTFKKVFTEPVDCIVDSTGYGFIYIQRNWGDSDGYKLDLTTPRQYPVVLEDCEPQEDEYDFYI